MDAEVSEFTACTIAAHFMANRIVCPLVDAADLSEDQQEQMAADLGNDPCTPALTRGVPASFMTVPFSAPVRSHGMPVVR